MTSGYHSGKYEDRSGAKAQKLLRQLLSQFSVLFPEDGNSMLFLNVGRYPLEDSVLEAYLAVSLYNRFWTFRRTLCLHLKRSRDPRRMPRRHYAVSKRRKPMTQRRIMSWKCPIYARPAVTNKKPENAVNEGSLHVSLGKRRQLR